MAGGWGGMWSVTEHTVGVCESGVASAHGPQQLVLSHLVSVAVQQGGYQDRVPHDVEHKAQNREGQQLQLHAALLAATLKHDLQRRGRTTGGRSDNIDVKQVFPILVRRQARRTWADGKGGEMEG